MTISFNKQRQKTIAGVPQVDPMNNPIIETTTVSVDDCLVAPITEPTNIREQQAMEQSRDQVRVHISRYDNKDVSDGTFTYNGKTFRVDSQSVDFMPENCPTKWIRYFRAEVVQQ